MKKEDIAIQILRDIIIKYSKVEYNGDLLGYTKEWHDARKILSPEHNGIHPAINQDNWISVEDRLPETVSPVLVLGSCCFVCNNMKIAEFEDGWYESETGDDLNFNPDFWQPLPEPPVNKYIYK